MNNFIPLRGIYSKRDFTINSKVIGEGAEKKVFFTRDRKYAVGVYKKDLDAKSVDRLRDIIENYRKGIFQKAGCAYWNKLYAWPVDLVQTGKGKWGVVTPVIPGNYYFSTGELKGEEKKGNWFVFKNPLKLVKQAEKGNWKRYMDLSLHMARAVRRLHAAGLTHGDLSFNNILVDPGSGFIYTIDLDNLVVPGKYPPSVAGTPGFIAPEVLKSLGANGKNGKTFLPCMETDLYALSVMIYMFLFKRHPLEGGKVWAEDPARDENLQKGEKALFIEDSRNPMNRIKDTKDFLPWSDTDRLPYMIAGLFLTPLFKKAFEDGLHNPAERPLASEWESALVKTMDLMVECTNPKCEQKWFVFNKKGICPFCGTKLADKWPVVSFYKKDEKMNEFVFDNQQLIPFHGKKIYSWHCDTEISLNEKLDAADLKVKGYFYLHNGEWYLVNKQTKGIRILNGTEIIIPDKQYFKINSSLKLIMGENPNASCMEFKFLSLK